MTNGNPERDPTTPRHDLERTPQPILLRVESVADQGAALARLDGKAVFLPFAAPGDLVEAVVARTQKRHAYAKILRILEPSPARRPPACSHFGTCGGCQWQHLAYGDQVAGKAAAFRGFLKSRLGLADAAFLAPLASPQEWGYRGRVGLKVRQQAGGVVVGYFEKGSHRIVPVRECPIAHDRIQRFLPSARAFLERFPATRALPQIDLQVDGLGGLWAIFHTLRPLSRTEARALAEFSQTAGLSGAHNQFGRKHTLAPLTKHATRMPFPFEADGRNLELGLSAGGFAQANAQVNARLVSEVGRLADLYRSQTALDLFCGAGNFTLPLALHASDVVAVEAYPPAAADAEDNARVNGFSNVKVLAEPAERALARLISKGCRPRFVLLDPPREGAEEAVGQLVKAQPDHVLYISCAPPTLVRDLGILAAGGYRVEWTRMADMFPQTAHLESITLLRRSGR